MPIKCISFDLDGTLSPSSFDKLIWNEEIPKLYASTHGVSIDEAKTKVYAEYYKALYIENVKDWTNIDMWFRRFGLSDYQALLDDMRYHITLYDDAIPTLEALSKTHKLIMVTSAEKHFFTMKLEATGLQKYFAAVYSAPSDFGLWKKNSETFKEVLKRIDLKPEEVLHVGDERSHDYEAPSNVGIKALLLDSDGGAQGDHVIRSLSEIEKWI